MDRNGLRSVAGVLLYGSPGSVDRVVEKLTARNDLHTWETLVETLRSDEELAVRVRCLEVLARCAAAGGDPVAKAVLGAFGEIGTGERRESDRGGHGV